jgi:hypothetical protein
MPLNFTIGSSCRLSASTHLPTEPAKQRVTCDGIEREWGGGVHQGREHQGLSSRHLVASRAVVAAQQRELEENAARARQL